MKKLKIVPIYIIAYITYAIFILLFLWFILLSRSTWLALMKEWAGINFQRTQFISFFDRGYILVIGMVWLALMIIVESYFRNGVAKGILLSRIGKVLGPEILAICAVDFIQILMFGLINTPASRWGVFAMELILGIGMLWIGLRFSNIRWSMEQKRS